MASTRFINDRGLTARMTLVMFLLGALFVALVVGLMYAGGTYFGGLAVLIGIAGLGVAWFQWYNSDTLALKAMRAREVTPEEAPELHGVIDRLCALADMPKPRVAIAYTDMPNAFATGRSPEPLGGVRDHRHPRQAHRRGDGGRARPRALPRRPPRRAGDDAGRVGRHHRRACSPAARSTARSSAAAVAARQQQQRRPPFWLIALVISLVVYAVSFFLTRLLSRYRELCADRAGAFLTQKPSALASALTKISGEVARDPEQGPARGPVDERLLHHPGDQRHDASKTLTSTHPSLEQRLEQLAKVAAELGKPMDGGFPAPGIGR